MTFDYSICPHCGCRCEDTEYCASCGRMFHEDQVPGSDVSVFKVFRNGLRSLKFHALSQDEFEEEPEFDRTWAFLPSNIFHED